MTLVRCEKAFFAFCTCYLSYSTISVKLYAHSFVCCFPFRLERLIYLFDYLSSSVRFLLKKLFFYSIVKDLADVSDILVGLDGLEPSTSRLSGARSSHLSYKPEFNS